MQGTSHIKSSLTFCFCWRQICIICHPHGTRLLVRPGNIFGILRSSRFLHESACKLLQFFYHMRQCCIATIAHCHKLNLWPHQRIAICNGRLLSLCLQPTHRRYDWASLQLFSLSHWFHGWDRHQWEDLQTLLLTRPKMLHHQAPVRWFCFLPRPHEVNGLLSQWICGWPCLWLIRSFLHQEERLPSWCRPQHTEKLWQGQLQVNYNLSVDKIVTQWNGSSQPV